MSLKSDITFLIFWSKLYLFIIKYLYIYVAEPERISSFSEWCSSWCIQWNWSALGQVWS